MEETIETIAARIEAAGIKQYGLERSGYVEERDLPIIKKYALLTARLILEGRASRKKKEEKEARFRQSLGIRLAVPKKLKPPKDPE